MKLTIEIKTDGAAFDEFGVESELDYIFRRGVLQGVGLGTIVPNDDGKLYDSSGNAVGYWEWK